MWIDYYSRKECDYVICNKAGKPTNLDSCINTVYKAAKLKGVGGAHILRRTFATKCFQNNERIEDIAAYLGDEVATVRKHYISNQNSVEDDEGKAVYYVPAM